MNKVTLSPTPNQPTTDNSNNNEAVWSFYIHPFDSQLVKRGQIPKSLGCHCFQKWFQFFLDFFSQFSVIMFVLLLFSHLHFSIATSSLSFDLMTFFVTITFDIICFAIVYFAIDCFTADYLPSFVSLSFATSWSIL